VEFTALLSGDQNPNNDQIIQPFSVSATSFFDVYTRDNPDDDGEVPTQTWWQSPDILVRNQDDNIRRHQDPILGQPNTVYVQVRNIGNDVIEDGAVNVYWHAPSPGIACGNWALVNPEPIQVGTLAPGETRWVNTTWTPPIEGHTCFFSAFSSAEDPVTYECDVPWDNNLAQRNVEVLVLEDGGGGLSALNQVGETRLQFELGNVRPVPASADLVIERDAFPLTGTVTLEFSHELFSRWLAETGGSIVGGEVVPGTTQVRIQDPISGSVLGLPLRTRETQPVWINVTGPVDAEFTFNVVELIDGEPVGGMTYRSSIPWTVKLPLVVR
jgi:hypothetical protein